MSILSTWRQQMEKDRVVAKNVSLYPEHWAVVTQVAKDTGQRSASGGLRAIIAEYVKMKAKMANATISSGQGV